MEHTPVDWGRKSCRDNLSGTLRGSPHAWTDDWEVEGELRYSSSLCGRRAPAHFWNVNLWMLSTINLQDRMLLPPAVAAVIWTASHILASTGCAVDLLESTEWGKVCNRALLTCTSPYLPSVVSSVGIGSATRRLLYSWKWKVRFEVFTAVTMKKVVLWVVTPRSSFLYRRLGG
jgi:hypothetical protein